RRPPALPRPPPPPVIRTVLPCMSGGGGSAIPSVLGDRGGAAPPHAGLVRARTGVIGADGGSGCWSSASKHSPRRRHRTGAGGGTGWWGGVGRLVRLTPAAAGRCTAAPDGHRQHVGVLEQSDALAGEEL